MMYSEKELNEVVQMILCGNTLDEAKKAIIIKYKLNDQGNKILELAEKVKEYFNVDTLVSPSRKTEQIAPMVVFSYLIHEILGDYKATKVHQTFTIVTGKSRCTFIHYTKMYETNMHMIDRRVFKNNYLTNHFLILKGKILNEEIDNDLLFVEEKVKKISLARERFEQKRKKIVYDLENNMMSYSELNNKYFFLSTDNGVKKFFMNEEYKYVKFIRNSYKTRLSKIIDTYKVGFIAKLNKGYGFDEINKHFNVYPITKTFKEVAYQHEKIIFDIILKNENDKKKKIQTNQ